MSGSSLGPRLPSSHLSHGWRPPPLSPQHPAQAGPDSERSLVTASWWSKTRSPRGPASAQLFILTHHPDNKPTMLRRHGSLFYFRNVPGSFPSQAVYICYFIHRYGCSSPNQLLTLPVSAQMSPPPRGLSGLPRGSHCLSHHLVHFSHSPVSLPQFYLKNQTA